MADPGVGRPERVTSMHASFPQSGTPPTSRGLLLLLLLLGLFGSGVGERGGSSAAAGLE